MTIDQQMRNALLNYGAIGDSWRIKITDKEVINYSDWAKVTVELYKPRCRKPYAIWELVTNTVRCVTDFEKSTYIRLN